MKTKEQEIKDFKKVPVNKIKANPYQTRLSMGEEPLKLLTKSIRERGLFNPITVLKTKGEYIIVSGHRRLTAVKRLKWKTIPAFIKSRINKNSLITDLIHENLMRENLNIQEKALSIKLLFSQIKGLKNNIQKIISCISAGKLWNTRGDRCKTGKGSKNKVGYKISDDDMFMGMKLLKTIGMSENNAISYLTILKLPSKIQRKVAFNIHSDQRECKSTKISIRMACNLARIDDAKYRDYLLNRALSGCSARHIEALVNNYKLKVLKGEWKGFVKKFNNFSAMKGLDKNLFMELSEKCQNLSKRLNSWKLTKLSALAETMEKEIFIAEATRLRKEMRLVDEQLKKRLADKGYKNVENFNEVFEIPIKKAKNRGYVRGSIPIKMLRRVGIDDNKLSNGIFIQFKIIGIKK